MKRWGLVFGFALFLVIGCATSTLTTWEHPDNTKGDQAFYKDKSECEAIAGQAMAGYGQPAPVPVYGPYGVTYMPNYSAGKAQSKRRHEIFSDCMMGRGWRIVKVEKK